MSDLRLLNSSCTWNSSPITVLDTNASIPRSTTFSLDKKSLVFENLATYCLTAFSTILMAFALPFDTPVTPDASDTSKALLVLPHINLLSIGNDAICSAQILPAPLEKYFLNGIDLNPFFASFSALRDPSYRSTMPTIPEVTPLAMKLFAYSSALTASASDKLSRSILASLTMADFSSCVRSIGSPVNGSSPVLAI